MKNHHILYGLNMHALTTNTHLQKRIKGKNFLLYNSKFFAASTVAMIAISSYCIIKGVIYGWKRFENIFLPFPHKIDRFSSALILSSATFAVFSLTLLISYGVFRYRNKNNCDNKKEAGKIISNEIKSVSGKMLISTSAIGAFVLACAALTASANNRDVLSAMSRAFGFSKNGSWIGGLGGLLLCFIVSSLTVFAVSSVISFCFKGKNHERYEYASKKIHEENSQQKIKQSKQEANAQLGETTSTPERRGSNDPNELDSDKALGKAYEDSEETAQSMERKNVKPTPSSRTQRVNKQNEGADNGGNSILEKVESLRQVGFTDHII